MTRPQNHREELHQINFIIKWEAAASNAQSRRRRRLWFTLRITQCLRSLSGLSGCGSADTIMNPRSLSKHCRRGLSHVCNVNWKPSWMSNQNYRKENRLYFSELPSYYHTWIALDLKEKLGNGNSAAQTNRIHQWQARLKPLQKSKHVSISFTLQALCVWHQMVLKLKTITFAKV